MKKSENNDVVLSEVNLTDYNSIIAFYKKIFKKEIPSGFEISFKSNKGLRGFKLSTSDELVGYLGCNFIRRYIDGIYYNFYNCHTWLVEESYRQHSLKLLLKLHQQNDGIITNFSPTDKVYQLLCKLGYKEIRSDRSVYVPSIRNFGHLDIKKVKSPSEFESLELKEIVEHHLPYSCLLLKINKSDQKDKLLVLRKTSHKSGMVVSINEWIKRISGRPFFTDFTSYYIVHYCSDWSFLNRHLEDITFTLLKKFGIGGLIINDDRIDNDHCNRLNRKVGNEFGMFLCNRELPFRLDQLYSEIFYLDIYNK